MATVRMFLIALMWLAPAAALAHGPDGHPADPNLHVDPTLEDCSVIFSTNLTQSAFHRFTREFGSVSAFKPWAPAATLGRGRFSIGIQQIWFSVEDRSDAWNDTFAHPDAYHELGADLDFPKVQVGVGVTDRMDIGGFFTRNFQANYGWVGVDLKYQLLQQSPTSWASVSLRGAYTKTLFVDDMDMHAITTDVAASRVLAGRYSPYLYLGSDFILARETTDKVTLEDERVAVPHLIGGLDVRFWNLALGGEVQVSELTSFQVRVATVF